VKVTTVVSAGDSGWAASVGHSDCQCGSQRLPVCVTATACVCHSSCVCVCVSQGL